MAKQARSTEQSELAFPKSPAKKGGRTPEETARVAVASLPTTPSGHRVKLALTLFLTREVAEYLFARAIREGRNTPAVIADILTAESRRRSEEG
jgi:hypothetical protein